MKNKLSREDFSNDGYFARELYLINRREALTVRTDFDDVYSFPIDRKSEPLLLAELKEVFPELRKVIYSNYYIDNCLFHFSTSSGGYTDPDTKMWVPTKEARYRIYFMYTEHFSQESKEKFIAVINKYKIDEKPKECPNIHFIGISTDKELYLREAKLKKVELDIAKYYNTDYPLSEVMSFINNPDKQGLFLFKGGPGTGKSYFIRHLSQTFPSLKFVFIPQEQIHVLTDINFEEFAFEDLKDSIIIIEDCEIILADRKTNKNPIVSSILNLTDGLLGEALNLKVIATLNTADNIDTALLRKGRLLASVTFKELTIDQANEVSKAIGKEVTFTKNTALAEVFNSEENSAEEKKDTIGFKIGTLV